MSAKSEPQPRSIEETVMTNAELLFDQTEIQAELPFEIRATSIPGVYDIPALPPDFDPRTATAKELRGAGLPWRRSVTNRNPVTREPDRATARRYTPVDESVTTFGPPPGLALPKRGIPNSNGYNTWAGSVVWTPGETWTGVEGQWGVPFALPGPQPPTTGSLRGKKYNGWWMSSWVGLGGWLPSGSDNILQIGVQQFVGQIDDSKDL
jgi:Peptidase A4 family